MTLNETYEEELRVPVRYVNVPKNAVLTSQEVDTVRVTLKDKGYLLMSYLYGDVVPPLEIDFKTHAATNGKGQVSATELGKMIESKIAVSTKITGIKPERLTFYYNYGEKKLVPIKWRGLVSPDDPYFISDVEYQPDSITVYASREKLDSISTVYTELLDFTNFHDTLTTTCRLSKLSGVKFVPEKVTVKFMTDILTEASIDDVPVRGLNMPDGKVLRTFPSMVKVKFVTGAKNYRTLTARDFVVVADYNELKSNPSPKCNIYLRNTPHGVSRATLETKTVDYLIEEYTP